MHLGMVVMMSHFLILRRLLSWCYNMDLSYDLYAFGAGTVIQHSVDDHIAKYETHTISSSYVVAQLLVQLVLPAH